MKERKKWSLTLNALLHMFLYYISKIHLYVSLCKTMSDHVRLEIKEIFYILFFYILFLFLSFI